MSRKWNNIFFGFGLAALILMAAGIDMDDEILQDLYLTVDVALSCLTVSPEGWNHTGHTEIFF